MRRTKNLKTSIRRVISLLELIDDTKLKQRDFKMGKHRIDKHLPSKNEKRMTWRAPSDVYRAALQLQKLKPKGTSMNDIITASVRLALEDVTVKVAGRKKFKLRG